ncbi:MAG: hypothetical protein M0P71_01700 [Melioribacteraceae bacterium]|nr:hypothetical protein [Melioribacteraceae bacterium]
MNYIDVIIDKHEEKIKAVKESSSCKGDFARKLLEKGIVPYFSDGIKIYEKLYKSS